MGRYAPTDKSHMPEVVRLLAAWGATAEPVHLGAELIALAPISEPVFAQRYHASDGPDRKIYSIGSEIFGVLRSWPARTHREKVGQAFTPDPELVDITRRCGAALGIDLFGITVVQSGGKPYVVDMTSIPGFKGVPDAPRRLAEYIYTAPERALRGAPLVSGVPTPVRDEPAVRPPVVRAAPPPARRTLSAEQALRPRVAMYSQGMVGFGHIRRNASIAQALRGSPLQPSIVLIAEAWQAGPLAVPPGVDCVTLPALRREADGGYNPRFLADVSDLDVISLRA